MELCCKADQVLSFDSVLDRFAELSFPTERVPRRKIRLAFLKAWVDHDLTRLDVSCLAILFDVLRSPRIPRINAREELRSDGVVCRGSARCNYFAGILDLGNRVSPNFDP